MAVSLNSQLSFIQYIESNYFHESKSVLLCTIIYTYLWPSSCLRLRSYGNSSKNTTEAINTSDLNIILYTTLHEWLSILNLMEIAFINLTR